MDKYIISGGSGLIGRQLSKMLVQNGHQVFILSTDPRKKTNSENVEFIYWDTNTKKINFSFGSERYVVINLAGAGVAEKRWTTKRKTEIVKSRINSLQTLYNAAATGLLNIKFLLSASAIGYYEDTNTLLDENAGAGSGFLSEVCKQWEQEAKKFETLNVSVCISRIGIVLSTEGGALKEFLTPLKYGVAAIPGNGKQILSWIHITDLCRMFIYLTDQQAKGVYNAVAPNAVSTNYLFDELLKIKKAFTLHIPEFMLKILLGEMSSEILKSAHVSCNKIVNLGFRFEHNNIESAITNLLRK